MALGAILIMALTAFQVNSTSSPDTGSCPAIQMDVLLDSLPFRPLLSRHQHHHHHHRQPSHPPLAQRTTSASSSDRWTESIDLLRLSLPPTDDPSSSSSPPSLLHPPTRPSPTPDDSNSTIGPFGGHLGTTEPKTGTAAPSDPAALALEGAAAADDAGGLDGDAPNDPSCRTCRQQQQQQQRQGVERQSEGVYYYYHHRPFCRACHELSDQSSVYFNYLKLASDLPPPPPPTTGPTTPRVPPPAARSPYSALGARTGPGGGGGAQRPYARVKTDSGAAAAASGVGGDPPGDRPIAAECRLLAARRRLFRLPSPSSSSFLFRLSGGCPSSRPKTSGSLDSSLVEGKADDESDGKTGNGKVVVTKNRGTGDRKCRRYRNRRVIAVAVFLLSLFIATAAAVLGIVLLWSPIHGTGRQCSPVNSSSLKVIKLREDISVKRFHNC